LFCPVVSHSVASRIGVLRGARTYSGRRRGTPAVGDTAGFPRTATDGPGGPRLSPPGAELRLPAGDHRAPRKGRRLWFIGVSLCGRPGVAVARGRSRRRGLVPGADMLASM